MGTWENRLAPCDMPGKGDRATPGPGVAWGASTRLRAHEGPHERHGSTQGIGTRATSEATRDGQGGSLSGASYLRRWGTEAQGTHGREGDAGPHVKLESKTGETLRAPTVTPQRQCMAAQAAHEADRVCPTWAHRIDADVLREAYRHTHTSSAAGIDGVTAKPYAAHLAAHLRDLHERLRRGCSQAPPVERVWREKDDGGQRPMGKPTCEDKMVQRAVARRLAAIYAQDFQDSSYGFRRGRSPHEARHERRERCLTEGIGWLVEAEVSGYFESREQTWLRDMRRTRVNDGSIVRLMGKWLHAGVMEEGGLTHPETGVPQGGVRSPMVATIFLHHGLDAWFEREVRPRRKGRCFLMRCADDVVMGGELATDARRIMAVLPKRFAHFGLRIHPTQTTRVAFRKPGARQETEDGNGPFDFLGLTHDWPTSRRGCWVIKRKTAGKRLRRTKKSLWRWCRTNRHAPVKDQYQMLCLK